MPGRCARHCFSTHGERTGWFARVLHACCPAIRAAETDRSPIDTCPGTQVKSYAVGDSFGELALMFNQRRAASVTAVEDSVLWAVDQATFKAVMLASAKANKVEYN